MFELFLSSFQFPWWIYPLALLVGGFAGFVDSIAGGGGLITIPFLLSVGINPVTALGTNKFQATFGTFIAVSNYLHKKVIEPKHCVIGIVCTFIGASSGSFVATIVNQDFLNLIIPVLLITIAIYFAFKKNYSPRPPIMKLPLFYVFFGFLLGFYDGFFGPGTGAFWTMALILMVGFNITTAVGNTKIFNFTSNISSLIVFAFSGAILYDIAIFMALGQMMGSYLGSSLAVKKGVAIIRPITVLITCLISLKLLVEVFIE